MKSVKGGIEIENKTLDPFFILTLKAIVTSKNKVYSYGCLLRVDKELFAKYWKVSKNIGLKISLQFYQIKISSFCKNGFYCFALLN